MMARSLLGQAVSQIDGQDRTEQQDRCHFMLCDVSEEEEEKMNRSEIAG